MHLCFIMHVNGKINVLFLFCWREQAGKHVLLSCCYIFFSKKSLNLVKSNEFSVLSRKNWMNFSNIFPSEQWAGFQQEIGQVWANTKILLVPPLRQASAVRIWLLDFDEKRQLGLSLCAQIDSVDHWLPQICRELKSPSFELRIQWC